MTDPFGRNDLPKAPMAPSYFSVTRPIKNIALFILWLAYYAIPSETYWSTDRNPGYGEPEPFVVSLVLYLPLAITSVALGILSHKFFIGLILFAAGVFIGGLIRSMFGLKEYRARMYWKEKIGA